MSFKGESKGGYRSFEARRKNEKDEKYEAAVAEPEIPPLLT